MPPRAGDSTEGAGRVPSQPPLLPGLGLAGQELSRRGHPGIPTPTIFLPFLPFSFLINHRLLPNLNMEMPRPGNAIIPEARRAVRALGFGEHGGIAPFLVCVKLCAQKASPYPSV